LKNIGIKLNYEAWCYVRKAIADDLEPAILDARQRYNHEDILLCALLAQVLHRLDVRLASGRREFTINFSFPEAMGIHQAYAKMILSPVAKTYEGNLLINIINKIDSQVF